MTKAIVFHVLVLVNIFLGGQLCKAMDDYNDPVACQLHVAPRVVQGIPFPVDVECWGGAVDRESILPTTIVLSLQGLPEDQKQLFLYVGRGVATLVASMESNNARISLAQGSTHVTGYADTIVLPRVSASGVGCSRTLGGVLTEEDSLEWHQNSVVCVLSSLTIALNSTLRVHDGVIILMSEVCSIEVDGILEMMGTEHNPVMILPWQRGKPWGEVWLRGNRSVGSIMLNSWLVGGGGDVAKAAGRSNSQPVIRVMSTSLTMSGGGVVESPGKAVFAHNSSVVMHATMTARCDTGGEFHYSVLEMSEAHVVEIPDTHILDGADDNNDALSFFFKHRSGRPSRVQDSVLMRGHDNGIDHNDAVVHVVRTHIEEFLREGVAASYDASVLLLNSTVARCGHGVEAGLCQPDATGPSAGAPECNASIGLCSSGTAGGPRVRVIGGRLVGNEYAVYICDDYAYPIQWYPGRVSLQGVELRGNAIATSATHAVLEQRIESLPYHQAGPEEAAYHGWEAQAERCECGSVRVEAPLVVRTTHKAPFLGTCSAKLAARRGVRDHWVGVAGSEWDGRRAVERGVVVLGFERHLVVDEKAWREKPDRGWHDGELGGKLPSHLLPLLPALLPLLRHPRLSHALALCSAEASPPLSAILTHGEGDEGTPLHGELLLVYRRGRGVRLDLLDGSEGVEAGGVVGFGAAVAEALAFLQEGNAVGPMFHRDLCPRNVLFVPPASALVMDLEEAALSRFLRPVLSPAHWPPVGSEHNPCCNRNQAPWFDVPPWAGLSCRGCLAGYDVEEAGFEKAEAFSVGFLVHWLLRSTSPLLVAVPVLPTGWLEDDGKEPRHDLSGRMGGLSVADFPPEFVSLLDRAVSEERHMRPTPAELAARWHALLSITAPSTQSVPAPASECWPPTSCPVTASTGDSTVRPGRQRELAVGVNAERAGLDPVQPLSRQSLCEMITQLETEVVADPLTPTPTEAQGRGGGQGGDEGCATHSLIVYAFAHSGQGHHMADGWREDNLLFFLAFALFDDPGFQTVVVVNGGLDASWRALLDYLQARRPNFEWVQRENRGRDIAAWLHVLERYRGCSSVRRFLLLNASVRGPFVPAFFTAPWPEIFFGLLSHRTRLAGCDIHCGCKMSPPGSEAGRRNPALSCPETMDEMIMATFVLAFESDLWPLVMKLLALSSGVSLSLSGPTPLGADVAGLWDDTEMEGVAERWRVEEALNRTPGTEWVFEKQLLQEVLLKGFNVGVTEYLWRGVDLLDAPEVRRRCLQFLTSRTSMSFLTTGSYSGFDVHPLELIFFKTSYYTALETLAGFTRFTLSHTRMRVPLAFCF